MKHDPEVAKIEQGLQPTGEIVKESRQVAMSSYRFREFQQCEVLLGLQAFGGDLGGGRGQVKPLKSEVSDPKSGAKTICSGMSPNEQSSQMFVSNHRIFSNWPRRFIVFGIH